MKKHFWYCWFRAAANDEEREAWQLGHIDSYRYLGMMIYRMLVSFER